jgi:succinate dehydrogenase / fumarate reductase, cytochrome b subunit
MLRMQVQCPSAELEGATMATIETKSGGTGARPLSPHLQVYKLSWTMAMSIIHRITGAALYFGTALLAIWLVAAASGPEAYARVMWVYGSILGKLVLFGYTWALLHHLFGGLRHFVWDAGRNLDPAGAQRLAQIGLMGSVALTVAIWALVLALG